MLGQFGTMLICPTGKHALSAASLNPFPASSQRWSSSFGSGKQINHVALPKAHFPLIHQGNTLSCTCPVTEFREFSVYVSGYRGVRIDARGPSEFHVSSRFVRAPVHVSRPRHSCVRICMCAMCPLPPSLPRSFTLCRVLYWTH